MILGVVVGVGVSCLPGWAQAGASAASKTEVRTLDLLLDDDQLLPGAVTLEAGVYRIRLNNGLTPARLDIRLEDSKAAKLAATEMKAKASKAFFEVELKAGKHVLYVVQRPKWRCEVTVTEKGK